MPTALGTRQRDVDRCGAVNLKHAKPVGGTKSLSDGIRELLDSKRRAGRRESYIRILGWVLNAFERDFQGRNVNEITRDDVESWLDRIDTLTTRQESHPRFVYSIRVLPSSRLLRLEPAGEHRKAGCHRQEAGNLYSE